MRLPLIPSSFVFDDISPVNAKPIFAKNLPPPQKKKKKKKEEKKSFFFYELVIAKKVFMQER